MRFLEIILFLLNLNFLSGQTCDLPQFPKDWFGKWYGNLEVYKHQKIVQNVPMTFECYPTDSLGLYDWWITYGSDTLTGKRSYALKEIDKENGHYIIDENNGILIDGYIMAHKFISRFEVMGNQLSAIYERTDDAMIFEIFVNTSTESNTTGSITSPEGDKIPEVKSYMTNGFQRAVLKRIP